MIFIRIDKLQMEAAMSINETLKGPGWDETGRKVKAKHMVEV